MKKISETGTYSKTVKTIVFFVLLVVVIVWITPIVWGILCSFKAETEIKAGGFSFIPKVWTVENYTYVLNNTDNTPIIRWFANSFIMAGISAALSVVLVALTAYGYSRLKYKHKDRLFMIIMAFSLFPTNINIVPLYQVVSMFGWVNEMASIIVPTLGNVTYVFLVRQFSLAIPRDFDEAALIDGANEFQNFLFVILPMLKPVLTVVFLFTFTGVWNDFLWPSIVINDVEKLPLTSGLKLLQGAYGSFHLGPILASACLSMIPTFVLYIFSQKYFLQSMSLSSGIKA